MCSILSPDMSDLEEIGQSRGAPCEGRDSDALRYLGSASSLSRCAEIILGLTICRVVHQVALQLDLPRFAEQSAHRGTLLWALRSSAEWSGWAHLGWTNRVRAPIRHHGHNHPLIGQHASNANVQQTYFHVLFFGEGCSVPWIWMETVDIGRAITWEAQGIRSIRLFIRWQISSLVEIRVNLGKDWNTSRIHENMERMMKKSGMMLERRDCCSGPLRGLYIQGLTAILQTLPYIVDFEDAIIAGLFLSEAGNWTR